jgi:tetratricopeptide (TPR) repeat protein
MKLIIIPVLLCCLQVNAQSKPAKKDQMPSNKEMQEMMKEMQQAMNEMSEDDKKLFDSMGVKMPDLKNMQQMSAFASANAGKSTEVTKVPKKDLNRIAAVNKTPLTQAALPAYLQSVQQKLTETFPAELQQKIKNQVETLRKQQPGKNITAAASLGYFTLGNRKAALLLMGEQCMQNPGDANHLNNLAAMLNMAGGEHLALPILQLLNKQYPKNSTILNNIAHAWYGLGDISNAGKYIDSTIRLCAWHPQANQIKATIEESKGNHDGAVKAWKQSISKMYTADKERALNDLDYQLKTEDIFWNRRNITEQLGLSKFSWPGIPKSVEESELSEQTWNIFRADWDTKMATLKTQNEKLQAAYQLAFQQRMKHDMSSANKMVNHSAMMEGLVPKAIIKLRPYVDQLLELEAKQPFALAGYALQDTLRRLQEDAQKELEIINKTMKPGSEGTGINQGYCDAIDAVYNNLVRTANTLVEAFSIRHRDRAKRRIIELVNFKYYSEFPEKFELSVNEAKMEWLSFIIMPKDLIIFQSPVKFCKPGEKPKISNKHALADYDDINCPYRSKLDFYAASIETICGKTTVKVDAPHIKLEWESRSADREENRNTWDEFQRCTIEASVGYSKDIGKGPLQLEVAAHATGFLEFDRTGLKDAGVKAEVGVSVKTNVLETTGGVGPSEQSLSVAGAEATISINGGFTAGGTGILNSIRL